MTSPLRRKRRITARSTRPGTTRNHCRRTTHAAERSTFRHRGPWLAIVIASLLASAPLALAESSNSHKPDASYSTGKSGSQLKWLSSAPAEKQRSTDESVKPVQYAEPPSTQPPAELPSEPSLPESAGPKTVPPPAESGRQATPLPGPTGTVPKPPKENPFLAPENLLPLERERGVHGREQFTETCPSPKDLKHIGELSTNIVPPEGDLPHDCPLGHDVFQPRSFSPITFSWTASSLCHKPLYFEDVQLERYGHTCGPWLQPFMSAGQFFVTIPFLPYKMGLETPNECIYTLGYYRPGNCAPYMLDPIPLSVRAAFFEGAAIIGAGYAFP